MDPCSVLVVGGGVGGMRAAIDLAEAGIHTYLLETTPSLGGRVAQLGFMFPTHDCVLCRGTSDHGFGCTRPAISPALLDHNLPPQYHPADLDRTAGLRGRGRRLPRQPAAATRNTSTRPCASTAAAAPRSARRCGPAGSSSG